MGRPALWRAGMVRLWRCLPAFFGGGGARGPASAGSAIDSNSVAAPSLRDLNIGGVRPPSLYQSSLTPDDYFSGSAPSARSADQIWDGSESIRVDVDRARRCRHER